MILDQIDEAIATRENEITVPTESTGSLLGRLRKLFRALEPGEEIAISDVADRPEFLDQHRDQLSWGISDLVEEGTAERVKPGRFRKPTLAAGAA